MDRKKEGAIDPRRWTVVCKHWLKDLCQKDDSCEYLHQMDLSRMPVCPSITKGRPCSASDCVFKHVDPNQKRCEKYDYGYCKNGPNCRERHERSTKPPEYIPDRLFADFIHPVYHNKIPMKTDHLFREAWQVPFQGTTRYFTAKAETAVIERTLGNNIWFPHPSNYTVLKDALRQCENVALVFMDTQYVYGFAKILVKNESHDGETPLSFRLKFIKKCRMDLDRTNNFRNPYDGNNRVRMARDSQEIDPSVAEKLCSQLLQLKDRDEPRPGKRHREYEADRKPKKKSHH